MKPLRFLIFSASFGAGHVKAAEALIESIRVKKPTAEIIHEDPFEMMNRQLNNFIRFIYIKMIKHAPSVWGGLYNMTKDFNYDSLSYRHTNNIGRDKILQYIRSVNPDIIICTYPTTAGMLAQLRLDGELNIPVISVVTDYTIHNQWIHPGIDLNLVGNKEVYNGFIDKGIKESRLQISGIPVHPKFDLRPNKAKILRDFGLEEGRLTFLILGGAYGVLNKAKWILKYLGNIEANIQLMIVCGKDKKLYDSLDDMIIPQ